MHHIATLCLTLLFCFVYSTTFGQQELEIWNPLPSHSLDSKQALKAMDMPASFAAHQMTNLASLTSLLQAAPIRFSDEARHSPTAIALPMPNGQTERFKLVNFPVMEAGLAGRYPQLKTFTGISARNPHKTAKVTMTPQGLFAIILGDPAGTIFVRPFNLAEQTYYAFYAKDHPKDNEAFTCAMEDTRVEIDYHHAGQRSRDCQLRQYRLALACTGEYTQFYSDDDDSNGDIIADALASMVIMVNQLNGIFENELGTTLILVDQNTDIIFTNPNTDPYTNDSSSEMINENVPVCTNIIGDANFDIGHVFGLGGGGLAFRNSPCTGNKARGVTKVNGLPGTPSDFRTAAHEFGHQFGARHTQNNDCSRSAFASYEPGSGSTIMSYAGICFPSIQSSSDFYFHAVSIDEMSSFVTETGNSCATILNTANQQPVANAGDDYTIPFATPFVLTANGTDPEGDTLSYAWEQWDREFAPMPPLASSTEGPSFRSFPPSADPQRYFPRLEVLLGSAPNTWEVLPEVARPLNFRLTVRDNNDAYGCTAQSDMSITVDDTTGPFRVTYPDSDSLWSVGETQFINWDVANTNNAPINCANVDIFYSTDGGWTYPNVLATNVPNNGNYTFTVPEVTSATIRFMVKCADNIFFAISEENVSIGSQIICRQFNSSDVPIAISETGTPTIISQLDISLDRTITDINVVDLIGTHTFISDLRFFLIDPLQNELLLLSRRCGLNEDFNLIFDDAGEELICPMNDGEVVRPIESLTTYLGTNATGTWGLMIEDISPGDGGALQSWGLEICFAEDLVATQTITAPAIEVTLSPNPASTYLGVTIQAEEAFAGQLQIINAVGELLQRVDLPKQRNFQYQLPVADLPSGVYFVNVVGENGRQLVEKFVKL